MKVIINIPNDYHGTHGTEVRDSIDELEITLPNHPDLKEMVNCFKTILYAQTYHPETINRAFSED